MVGVVEKLNVVTVFIEITFISQVELHTAAAAHFEAKRYLCMDVGGAKQHQDKKKDTLHTSRILKQKTSSQYALRVLIFHIKVSLTKPKPHTPNQCSFPNTSFSRRMASRSSGSEAA